MKVTYNWLKDFVDIKIPAAKLAEKLTMAGLEVVSLEEKERLAESARQAGFRGVSDFVRAAALTATTDAFAALPGKRGRAGRAGTRRKTG